MTGYNYIIEHLPMVLSPKVDPLGFSAIYRHHINVGEEVVFDHVGVMTVFTFTDQASLDGMMAALSVVRAGTVSGQFDGVNSAYIDCQVYEVERKSFKVSSQKSLRSIVYVKPYVLPVVLTDLAKCRATAKYPFIPLGAGQSLQSTSGGITFRNGRFFPWAQTIGNNFEPVGHDFSVMPRTHVATITLFHGSDLLAHMSPTLRFKPGVYNFNGNMTTDTFLGGGKSWWYLIVASYPEM